MIIVNLGVLIILISQIEGWKSYAMSATLNESPTVQTKKLMQRNTNYNQDGSQYQDTLGNSQQSKEPHSPGMLPHGATKRTRNNDGQFTPNTNGSPNAASTDPIRKSKKYDVKISIRPEDVNLGGMYYEEKTPRNKVKETGPTTDKQIVKLSISQKKCSLAGERNAGQNDEKQNQRCLSSSFAYQVADGRPPQHQKRETSPNQGKVQSQNQTYQELPQNHDPAHQYSSRIGEYATKNQVSQNELYTRRHNDSKATAKKQQKNQLRSSSSGFKQGANGAGAKHEDLIVMANKQPSEVHGSNARQPKSERVNSQKVKKKIKRDPETEDRINEKATPVSAKNTNYMGSENRITGSGGQRLNNQHSSPAQDIKTTHMFPIIDSQGEKRNCQNSQIRQISNCQVKKYDQNSNMNSKESVQINRQINSAMPIPEQNTQSAPRPYNSYQQTSIQSPSYNRQHYEESPNHFKKYVSDHMNIEDYSRAKRTDRPLVMGLGLGMGIQMGSDGKFYASMGGVSMPTTGVPKLQRADQTEAYMEQAYGQKPSPSKKDQLKKSAGKGLISSKELEEGHDLTSSLERLNAGTQMSKQQVQQAKMKFEKKRNSKLMNKKMEDYQELYQQQNQKGSAAYSSQHGNQYVVSTAHQDALAGNRSSKHSNQPTNLQLQVQQSFGSPISTAEYIESQQQYSSTYASEAAARGNYLEQHYNDLNSKQHQKMIDQQARKQAVVDRVQNDKKITKDQASLMAMMASGNNQPVVGLHISHAHPSELVHSQSDARRNYTKMYGNNGVKGKQMNSTNDTSFTEPVIPEPDDLHVQHKHIANSVYSSPQNHSNLTKLKGNQEDISKTEKAQSEARPFIHMKTKAVEDLKQLKLGTGNQIISAGMISVPDRSRVQSLQNTVAKVSESQMFIKQQKDAENAFNLLYQQVNNDNIQACLIQNPNEPHRLKKRQISGVTTKNRSSNEMIPLGGINVKRRKNHESQLLLQDQRDQQSIRQVMQGNDNDRSLQYKMLNGKRSQPPMSEFEIKDQQRQMFKAQVEHIKSNSIAALQQSFPPYREQEIGNITRSCDRMGEQKTDGMVDFGKLTGSTRRLQPGEPILMQETVLEQSPDALGGASVMLSQQQIDWIKLAMEANRRTQNQSNFEQAETSIESDQAMELARQLGEQMIAQAQSRFSSQNQLLTTTKSILMHESKSPHPPTKTTTLLAPFMNMSKDEAAEFQASTFAQIKKPNMNDSHVKRARLQLEKKKKIFEQPQRQIARGALNNSGFQVQQLGPTSDQNQHPELIQNNNNNLFAEFGGIGARGTQIGQGFVCTPQITYKSAVPPQSTKVQRNSDDNHPLINSQLFNGYAKNITAAQSVKNKNPGLGVVQIRGQNFSVLQKQLNEAQLQAQKNANPATQEQLIAELQELNERNLLHFESPRSDRMDVESLAILNKIATQAQLEMQYQARQAEIGTGRNSKLKLNQSNSKQKLLIDAVKAAETGNTAEYAKQQQLDQVFANGVPKVSQGKLIVFTHNGQTFVRNHDATKVAQLTQEQQQSLGIQIADAQQLADSMAQLAQNSLGGVIMPDDIHQLLTLATNQYQIDKNQSITGISNINRSRIGKPQKLAAQSPTKVNQKNSEASLSTKPNTSTTLNSSNVKGQKVRERTSPTKMQKKKVHIWHENKVTDHHKNHRINKAINTINQIINLVFKNKKDSLALTSMSAKSDLGPPANRLIDENRVNELQKIAKKINITIPKKFESKTALREFFYSREFILNVKIKMNNLLHNAILVSNRLPIEVIHANMYSNYDKMAASKAEIVNGSESKPVAGIYMSKKFWVGQGNNFPIIKSVLKQRYWWQLASGEDFEEDCDFIWTAWKKQRHIDFLSKNQNKYFARLEREKKAAHETAKKKKKEKEKSKQVSHSSDEDSDDKSYSKNNPICMPRNSVKPSEEPTKFPKTEAERIVQPIKLYSRVENNKQLTNKKGIFINMRRYYESMGDDPFKVLPLTYHTTKGIHDNDYRLFATYYADLDCRIKRSEEKTKAAIKAYYKEKKSTQKSIDDSEPEDFDEEAEISAIKLKYRSPKNTWIIKPGENTNRGQGIQVVKNMKEVLSIISRTTKQDRTFIIQKYIDYPLLVHKRKFDFRVFGMLTSINGSLKGYCYQDGYVRTSSREYNLDDVSDTLVHLTNDAIQNKSDDYGKFENANKMSFQDFSKVISAQRPDLDFDMQRDIFPQIQKLIADTYRATFLKIDPTRLQNTFELFGYDFMIDEDMRLYLIEVNTNPCLEVCCPLLARIIPEVLDNCFKIVLDPLFPSPDMSHNRKFQLNELPQEVKFQLVFDEEIDGPEIKQMFRTSCKGSIPEHLDEAIESDKEEELAADDGEESGDAY